MKIDWKLKRLMPQYEEGHFDRVIKGYRECTVSSWDPSNSVEVDENTTFMHSIVNDMKAKIKEIVPGNAFDSQSFIAPHILDLRDGNSGINAHIDYLDASGGIISGLSLLSPAVMIFKFKEKYAKARYVSQNLSDDQRSFKVLIPSNSLYIQWDELRYEFTHEIPNSESIEHSIDGQFVKRGRRVAIILRDKKKHHA